MRANKLKVTDLIYYEGKCYWIYDIVENGNNLILKLCQEYTFELKELTVHNMEDIGDALVHSWSNL